MPNYIFDLTLGGSGGGTIGTQNWLMINYAGPTCWGFCSSLVGLNGKTGKLSFTERTGYTGTYFFEGDTNPQQKGNEEALFRLDVFRGGIIDQEQWKEGSTGTGQWVRIPTIGKAGDLGVALATNFAWRIRSRE